MSPTTWPKLVTRVGEPVIRTAFRQAMRIMGHQFVMGRSIEEALKRAASEENRGSATPTTCWARRRSPRKDAERYFQAYSTAIDAIGATRGEGRGCVCGAQHLRKTLGPASALRTGSAHSG